MSQTNPHTDAKYARTRTAVSEIPSAVLSQRLPLLLSTKKQRFDHARARLARRHSCKQLASPEAGILTRCCATLQVKVTCATVLYPTIPTKQPIEGAALYSAPLALSPAKRPGPALCPSYLTLLRGWPVPDARAPCALPTVADPAGTRR